MQGSPTYNPIGRITIKIADRGYLVIRRGKGARMPIKIPKELPALKILEKENIFAITEDRAIAQDIRPLKIAIINLMPTRQRTEVQILRLLANSPLQTEVSLVRLLQHNYKSTSEDYLQKFYITSEEMKAQKFDGLIITGAPLEQFLFEEVDYWSEICAIMDWARDNVYSTLFLCWAAFAGLYYHYKISRYLVPEKIFGVFMNYKILFDDPLLRGLDDTFPIPQSRHITLKEDEIIKQDGLVILAKSLESGVTLVRSEDCREVFMTGHLEYDTDTLAAEYWRDKLKGLEIELPKNYFPNNNTSLPPQSYWRSSAYLFYNNWLNYYVYQKTPFGWVK